MKFLADMGVSPLTVKRLKQEGYDAIHLNEEVFSECSTATLWQKPSMNRELF